MADDHLEKDLDDEVYEDDYYDENYDEEELEDLDDSFDDDDDSGEGGERKVHISYACEDCDYRWDEVIIRKKHDFDDELEADVICPMCGSINITLI